MSDKPTIPQKPPNQDNWLFKAELEDISEAHDALVQLINPALPVRTIAIMKEILWQGYLFESNRIALKYRNKP